MNNRLKTIVKHIEDGIGVIDVGTDHGYLPLALVERGYSGKIIASDINEEPLNKARRNAAAASADGCIDFRLSDGLESCSLHEVDTIVIAGMGGDTICGILDRAEWCMAEGYKLIMQPMTKGEILRYWLANNGFVITNEERVKENGSIYQIIVAVFKDNTVISDGELFVGQYELIKGNELFSEELEIFLKRFYRAADGMKGVTNKKALHGIYTNIIAELEEMRRKHGDS